MPMPNPKQGETKEEFVKRFMSNPTMMADYPDEKQRYAICEKQWEDKNMMNKNPDMLMPMTGEDMQAFMDRFMKDEKMIMMYPDENNRKAAAKMQYNSVDRYSASNIDYELKFIPPESGDAPKEIKDILDSAYSSCRLEWTKAHPDDKENDNNKTKCSQIAWGAVHNAGWEKDSKGNWHKTQTANQEYEEGCILLSNVQIQPTESEQLLKVFPRGIHYVDKYKKDIDFNDEFYNEIANAFKSESLSKPKIDKDHEFKSSFGDINNYEIKPDGMYFKVKLNPKGVELVKNREYNYISPAWGRTKDNGKKDFPNRLLAVSLVNFPALEGSLPSLQEQLRLSKFEIVQQKNKTKEASMELYILAKELGLNSEASIDAIYTEVKTLKAGYETATNKVKIAEDTAIKLSQELKEIKDTTLKAEAFEAVRKWIELGKVHPAVQDIVIDRYILNKESVVNEMNLIPEKVYSGKKSANTDTNGIDPEIEKTMLKAGLDPKNKEDVEIFMSLNKGGK